MESNHKQVAKGRPFWHYCEVCGKRDFITAKAALDAGWDYPPHFGGFGLLGPRTCGNCSLKDTLFWKVHTELPLPNDRNIDAKSPKGEQNQEQPHGNNQ